MSRDKIYRILHLYSRFMEGGVIYKEEAAELYGVDVRTIQRDIADIRSFVESGSQFSNHINTIIYDRKEKGYRLRRPIFRKLSIEDLE